MGYYTRYSLEVHGCSVAGHPAPVGAIDKSSIEYQMIVDAIANESGYSSPFSQEIKWYDYDGDMKRISNRFPDLIFILSGEGEEAGDLWRAYFYRGKMQMARAKVSYDAFDHSALTR